MQFAKLGRSGLSVSRICLGAMSFGVPERGMQPWSLDEEASRPLIKQALELGINFFDTANIYSDGTSEEILGRALADFIPREEVVIATKVNAPMRPGANAAGLSRKAIMTEIDASLRRLGTDYVDLYQIHRFDYHTPIEETMQALDDVVKAGKARYLGASSMWSWQFLKMLNTADLVHQTRFISMQNHYNLLHREDEREMIPLCTDQGVGTIPWSPLARGRVARPWGTVTTRNEVDEIGRSFYPDGEDDRQIIERVTAVAAKHGVPMAHVALAWVLAKPTVVAPIVGITKASHLTDAVAALDVRLDDEDLSAMEEPYLPHAIVGMQ